MSWKLFEHNLFPSKGVGERGQNLFQQKCQISQEIANIQVIYI